VKGSNATGLTPMGQVDIEQRLPGLPDWPRVIEDAELDEIDGLRVPVISLPGP
jgi:hypothetical protein